MKRFLTIIVILFLCLCSREIFSQNLSADLVNTSHLDKLYEEINIDGKQMGIIHIYSDYPDYKWTGDDVEGIACLDDASRAAVFYIWNYEARKDSSSLAKTEKLMEFLLYMQSDNGYFYNFIFKDHSINKKYKTSVNIPSWWSWRAMWALSEYYEKLKDASPELSLRILPALKKSVDAVKRTFSNEKTTKTLEGIKFPTWLPSESAGDQTAVMVLSLLNYFEETKDSTIINYINSFCDGILLMQKGDSLNVPYDAFLSWQNIWHAYGNGQSYALLRTSQILNRDDLQTAASNEINYFYDYLINNKYPGSFAIEKTGSGFKLSDVKYFSQIAYNFRPMIFACLEAFSLTCDSAYVEKAVRISGWYFGDNISGKQMYDTATGICFDGINSENEINMNSGAESTIEALLSMQLLEQFHITKRDLQKTISENKK